MSVSDKQNLPARKPLKQVADIVKSHQFLSCSVSEHCHNLTVRSGYVLQVLWFGQETDSVTLLRSRQHNLLIRLTKKIALLLSPGRTPLLAEGPVCYLCPS